MQPFFLSPYPSPLVYSLAPTNYATSSPLPLGCVNQRDHVDNKLTHNSLAMGCVSVLKCIRLLEHLIFYRFTCSSSPPSFICNPFARHTSPLKQTHPHTVEANELMLKFFIIHVCVAALTHTLDFCSSPFSNLNNYHAHTSKPAHSTL